MYHHCAGFAAPVGHQALLAEELSSTRQASARQAADAARASRPQTVSHVLGHVQTHRADGAAAATP